jgi:RNA polymerase sigma-70 factor (ECF subfamily)
MTLPLWCGPSDDPRGDSRRAQRYVALMAEEPSPPPRRAVAEPSHALVAKIRAGDADAFETLYRASVPRLLDFAERYVPADLAEDLVHAVMAAIWHRRHVFEIRTTVMGYLFGAVRREVLMHQRHQRVVHADALRTLVSPPPAPPSPETTASFDELRQALRVAIDALPARTRDVLMLRWVDELRYDEIADTLGISESAAKMHVHRAQPIVRPLLERFREP